MPYNIHIKHLYMSRTTLKDIAKALNTTIATVSRALHDHPEIGKEMKERVRDVAKLYNYKPNSTALSLKFQKSYRLGVIFPRLTHYYVTQIVSGMLSEAGKNGYKMLIAESNYEPKKELDYIQEFYELDVDAILILPSRKLNQHKLKLENLIHKDIPFLILDRLIYFDNIKTPLISSNDYVGTQEGIKHLLDQQYSKIAHLRGLHTSSLANIRHQAYCDALISENRLCDENWTMTCKKFTIEEGEELACKLMALPNPPDAIFCINDIIAVGVLRGLRKLGKKVPEEIGVLGFSNSDLAEVSSPTLSSINQPGLRIGKKSIQLVLSNIVDKKDISKKNVVLKTKLIIRESTQRFSQ